MKDVSACTGKVLFYLFALAALNVVSISKAEVQSGQVLIQAVKGVATYSTGDRWSPLKENMTVGRGTTIKTDADSTVDLILQYSGTVLRLTPNSKLSFAKLNKEAAGEEVITETSLNLVEGSIVGSQRKLASPSTFEINLPDGVATIKGTEYLVRADGAVTCLSGSVSVNYNLPHNGGSVRVIVPAGYSFNPSTGQVVATSPAYLQNIIADINTVRQNAQVFKAGGATVVVKPEGAISPTKGNNGVGNGIDPQPPGNPPVNDGPGTGPGNPGNKGGGGGNKTTPRNPHPN
jgi:FecR-like protein